jgi:elongation factor Tu
MEKEYPMTTDPFFRMTVEDVFNIAKRGTVVTGKIEQGTLKVGDQVTIQGQNGERKTVVAGLEMFRKVTNQASAGDSVGILFKELSKQDVQRGDLLLGSNPDFSWKP